ncbi:MAG: phosphatase [Ruminococcus sp.]|nr:phosphatase [Ruminococcus sp.]
MNINLVIGQEIAHAETDVIVNASNGCGWMGGFLTRKTLQSGVAEHLNYYTHGNIEKEAKIKARKIRYISAFLIGTSPGNIFMTSNHELKCKEVIHAVTMRYPGTFSSYRHVESCLKNIFHYCEEQGHKSISIPLLGCGTGRLHAKKVIDLIENIAKKYEDIQVFVYSLKKIN